MTRETIERYQVWLYIAAISLGLAVGSAAPAAAPILEALLWPALALLLYVTFTQVSLNHLTDAFRDTRFLAAVLIGNFLLVPLLVLALLPLLPGDTAIELGVLLVLLVPCTDWFITFVHLARGDTKRAIAVTPVNLLLQLLLLPVYLWLFIGESFVEFLSTERLLIVFGVLIVIPLAAAYLTEILAERRDKLVPVPDSFARFPVPLLGLVVFLIAASQVETVLASLTLLGPLLLIFSLFLLGAAVLGVCLAKLFGLPVEQARTLVFSLGTRNSFVVLPFALALPQGFEIAAIVIVFQSLVELFGMIGFLWWVPQKLLPHSKSA